jgi:hypothetical protein
MLTPVTIIGIAMIYCFLIGYLLNGFLNLQYRKHVKLVDSPISFSVVKAGYFIAAGFILSELPIVANSLFSALKSQYSGVEYYQNVFMYIGLFLGFILIILITIYFLTSGLFHIVTDKSRIRTEVANNNIEKSIFFAGLMLLLSLGIKTSVPLLLDFFIPYPTIPMFR